MQQTLVEYLINAAWQVPLVAVGAMVVTRVGGLAPRARNLVWLAFLAMAVVSPALSLGQPSSHHAVAGHMETIAPADLDVASMAPATANLDQADPWRFLRLDLDWRSVSLIKLVFVTAAAGALARLAIAGVAARRLVRESRAVVLSAPLAIALEQFAGVHTCKTPPVRECSRIGSPAVVGVFKPVILVPERFAGLAPDDQRAALLHEFAHVRRRDYAVNLLCELIALPVSWHPALYEIKAGVCRSRELACDAMASAAMASEETYARCLLSLAKSLGAPAQNPSAVLVGLFGKSDLEERLMHLLNRKGAQSAGVRTVRLVGAGLIATTILVPTALFRVTPAFAQAQTMPAVFAEPSAPPAPPIPPAAIEPSAVPSPPEPPAVPKPARTMHPYVQGHLSALPAIPPVPPVPPIPRLQPISNPADHAPVMAIQEDGGMVVDGDFQGLGKDGRFRALTPDEQRRIEATVRRAMAKAAEARKFVDSPEFKQRMADIAARQKEFAAVDQAKIQKQVEAAMATLKDAKVQAAMARAQAMAASAAMQESFRNAEQIQRDVEKAMRESTPSDEH
jgi:beta-lactamase regulating signal transducer with metallopeptidase domain